MFHLSKLASALVLLLCSLKSCDVSMCGKFSVHCFSPSSGVPKKLIFYGHSYLAQLEGIYINIQIMSTITLLILNIYLANHAVLGEISSSRITLFRAKYLAEIIGSGKVKIIIPPCPGQYVAHTVQVPNYV